jgi:hypothetical protein
LKAIIELEDVQGLSGLSDFTELAQSISLLKVRLLLPKLINQADMP